MKTQLHGYNIHNFGKNNYSYNMEAIIFNPKDITPQEVSQLPNVFLHPEFEPNTLEIFALLGTKEQFTSFYEAVKRSCCTKAAISKFGMPRYEDRDTWSKINDYAEELESSFKAWYK
jgi:hypothetical protein